MAIEAEFHHSHSNDQFLQLNLLQYGYQSAKTEQGIYPDQSFQSQHSQEFDQFLLEKNLFREFRLRDLHKLGFFQNLQIQQ